MSDFARTLPAQQVDLAWQLFEDPYNFDFLPLGSAAEERELERGLLTRVRSFLLELGKGSGRQPVPAGSRRAGLLPGPTFLPPDAGMLRGHLKMSELKPEGSGKMNLYPAAADELLRQPS